MGGYCVGRAPVSSVQALGCPGAAIQRFDLFFLPVTSLLLWSKQFSYREESGPFPLNSPVAKWPELRHQILLVNAT